MKQQTNYGGLKQQGIALPIIMIILVLAALVTIYTTTTSVKEQQVIADQYRSEQAFSAAQAGVEAGVERYNHFEDYVGTPEDDISSADLSKVASTGLSKGSYRVMFCDIWDDGDEAANDDTDEDGVTGASLMKDFLTDIFSCTNPINNILDADGFKNDERVGILSVGKPDDASGQRTISVVSEPGFKIGGGPPGPPLTARGEVGITGNITLINRYTNLTLWTGEDLDFGSAAVSTYIRPPSATEDWSREEMIYIPNSTAPGANIMHDVDGDGTDDVSAIPGSNNLVGQNSDALTGDKNLMDPDLDPDEMFRKVYSNNSRNDVREMAKEAGVYYTDINAIVTDPPKTGLIWLETSGSIDLGGNVGTFDAPAFLVIELNDEDADVFKITTGGVEIYGMVFVFGNADLKGSPKIYGSMMITGDVAKGAGSGTIAYDPASLETLPEGPAGLRGIEPGTWKDWGYVN